MASTSYLLIGDGSGRARPGEKGRAPGGYPPADFIGTVRSMQPEHPPAWVVTRTNTGHETEIVAVCRSLEQAKTHGAEWNDLSEPDWHFGPRAGWGCYDPAGGSDWLVIEQHELEP